MGSGFSGQYYTPPLGHGVDPTAYASASVPPFRDFACRLAPAASVNIV